MANETIVDFDQKLAFLCKRANIDTKKLLSDLMRHKNMHRRILKSWINNPEPVIHSEYREKLVSYWRDFHKIAFTHVCWSMSFKDFEDYLEHNKIIPTPDTAPGGASLDLNDIDISKKLSKFLGAYQLIRPHSADSNVFILEAMEILMNSSSVKCLMYSHNNPQVDYLFDGDIYIADRYYFSLLIRKHEEPGAKRAFRSITFFVGAGASREFISGLMLRGVTGGSGDQAVAVPFIAIHSDETPKMQNPDFAVIKKDTMHCLQKDGHILIGSLHKSDNDPLFKLCNNIFTKIQELENGLLNKSKNVMRTIRPADLKRIKELGLLQWTKAVNEYIGLMSTIDQA